MVDEQMRERVAHAIQRQCSALPWPDGNTRHEVDERAHWYAAADVAIAAMDDRWTDHDACDCPWCQTIPVEPEIVTVRPDGNVL